jgi:hypothetical protein
MEKFRSKINIPDPQHCQKSSLRLHLAQKGSPNKKTEQEKLINGFTHLKNEVQQDSPDVLREGRSQRRDNLDPAIKDSILNHSQLSSSVCVLLST